MQGANTHPQQEKGADVDVMHQGITLKTRLRADFGFLDKQITCQTGRIKTD